MYGLIALGYTMVYGIIQLWNFAHGEIFMVGAFGGLAVWTALPESLAENAFLALPLIFTAAVFTATFTAVLVERVAYRPLRSSPRITALITAIGVSIVLQESVRLFYPDGKRPQSFPGLVAEGNFSIGDVRIPWVSLFIVIVAFFAMLLLQAFVHATKTGKAMRAVSQDPDTARLMGIDVNRIIMVTFAVGAILAALAGVLQGMKFRQIDFHMGFLAGLKAFTAAVLGGIGNITGAVLGGLLLGITEVMATQYIPQGSAWKDVWAFIVLIVVLVFRPTGLLGEDVSVRA